MVGTLTIRRFAASEALREVLVKFGNLIWGIHTWEDIPKLRNFTLVSWMLLG